MTDHGQRADRFQRLVEPEIPMLLRVALSMTVQQSDAQDLVQDTLLRAWRSIDTFDGAHPRAWLLTVLRNANRNRYRSHLPLPVDPQVTVALAGQHTDPSAEDQALAIGVDADVMAALRSLKPDVARLVVLVDAHGLSYREAAELLGLPEGTVMSRLHRARKRIRKSLSPTQSDERGELR